MKVYCFSAFGHSLAVAEAIAARLGVSVCDISANSPEACHTGVVVFPVYCQNIPLPVKEFLKCLNASQVALVATYGRMCHGNVLYEAQRLCSSPVIAAAFLPTGHTYLSEHACVDDQAIDIIAEKIKHPHTVTVPKVYKNPFASFFPSFRSIVGVKLTKNNNCTDCGICEINCPMEAMHGGKPDNNCIRCLRCVFSCPQNALDFSLTPLLKLYLKNQKQTETVIY